MSTRPSPRRFACALALGLIAFGSVVAAAPCDIYGSAGNPCIAAHSTTRALYSTYTGPLYQVRRRSDNTMTDITTLSAGGVANASVQDTFCESTTCLISTLYDQSGRGNHLTQAPPGGFRGPEANGYDRLANAIGAPVTLNGQKAYGIFVSPGTGYRNNNANGTATGDVAEGIYAVLDGTHFNSGCCFDYGNAETNSRDTGNGHMETIYFGNCRIWGTGAGSGPWIMADLENGLFSGINPKNNPGSPSISHRFLTAIVKGGPNLWAIRGGDANSGKLSTFYDGERPKVRGYNPMRKEGAIILGIGGDNSVGAQGTFYEGVMTQGYPSDATEDEVQADIVAAKYDVAPLTSGPPLKLDSSISLRATAAGRTAHYLAHTGSTIDTQVVSKLESNNALKLRASWIVRTGLGNKACFSFESRDTPGSYIRHASGSGEFLLYANDGTKAFFEDATFCPQTGLSGQGHSIRSWAYPGSYIRYHDSAASTASSGSDPDAIGPTTSFNDDASWVIGKGFA